MKGESNAARGSGPRALPLLVLLLAPCLLAGDVRPADRFDTVVIDAGHGGSDLGARGAEGSLEKHRVFTLAEELARRLEAHGLRVVMTRQSDEFVSLERRSAIANDARGDIFLSIHANASIDHGVRGSETYFLALDASDDAAAQVASRENAAFDAEGRLDLSVLKDPFVALMGDLIATEDLRESSEFAGLVQAELAGLEGLRSRGVKQALFVVLSGVQMPAALVEVGFITNPGDERALSSRAGKVRIAKALERAVVAFGRRYDARRGEATVDTGR